MEDKEKTDIKFSEKFALKFRKIFIVSKLLTFLIVILLICAFVGLNVAVNKLDLPEIDVTANKIYTLSDSSKKALESINQDVKIYVFGIDESDSVVGLIKQYCEANDKISYEMLTKENNLDKVQEFELEDGYSIVVIESGGSKKIIDASSEFTSYDYSTYAEIDTTEQTITNSILSLSTENKPKVYFVEGHEEFSLSASEDGSTKAELGVLKTYLENEAFEVETINLTSAGNVPEDCDVLAIMSPSNDFLENEAQYVIDYINKGGNIFITQDLVSQSASFPNLQKVLDLYGVNVKTGYALETSDNKTVSNYPYIFRPEISGTSEITSDISSDSYMWLAYAQKLEFAEDKLEELNVKYEELLGTSDSAVFVTDLSSNVDSAAESAETGKCTVAALVTKTISEGTTDDTDEENSSEASDAIESKLVISANGRFMTDYVVSELSNQYPISYLGSNKDFGINTISYLADKENGLTIRKDMAGTSYAFTATAEQNRIVLVVIFSVPIIIILVGIVIWRQRKKRK